MAKEKESWRQRVNAKIVAVVVVPLVLVTVWWVCQRAGASFGDVLPLDLSQIESVTISTGDGPATYTQRGDIEAIVEHLRKFRYTSSVSIHGAIDMIGGIQFYDSAGQCLYDLGLGPGAVRVGDTLYMGDEDYFEVILCRT